MTIRLGVIGSSAGNGHPYSWSAIFNGYSVDAMQDCEYPVIAEYLGEQSWPEAKILGAEVSTIWTQDSNLSARIARASCIGHVSSSLDELESRVDAVLLARDDAENHLYFAKQFLQAGKPIYIDKPIALSMTGLKELYELQRYPGQIFTCSALRYSEELNLYPRDRLAIGEILSIAASTPRSWEKYAVHIIEPVLKMINSKDSIVSSECSSDSLEAQTLVVYWLSGVTTTLTTRGNVDSPVKIDIEGSSGERKLIFKDSFNAFKAALQDFVDGILFDECKSPFGFNERVVDLIARGRL